MLCYSLRTLVYASGVLAVALTGAACKSCKSNDSAESATESYPTTTRQRHYMTTAVTITVAETESAPVLTAIDAAFAEMERVVALVSEWESDSEISEVNRQAGRAPVVVGEELFSVIKTAHDVSTQSDVKGAVSLPAYSLGFLDHVNQLP